MNTQQRIIFLKASLLRATDSQTRATLSAALSQAEAAQTAQRAGGPLSASQAASQYRRELTTAATKVLFL